MTGVEQKLRASIDITLAERFRDQRAYVAYGTTDFALESAGLLYLRDQYHQQYLDFSGGSGLVPMGHADDAIRSRIAEQLAHYGYVGRPGEWMQRWPVEYARALSQTLTAAGSDPLQVLFTTDQDSAMSAASLIAQKVTNREFLTDNLDWPMGYADSAALVARVIDRFNRLADPGALNEGVVRARNDGALIIADERRSGFGVTGKLWGQERWNYDPDITVVGGPGGAGFPFGAVVAPESYFAAARDWVTRQATAGHPAICGAGMTVLQGITEPVLEHVSDGYAVLNDGVQELVAQFPHIIEGHSGVGMIHHLRFHNHKDPQVFADGCRQHGLIVGRVHDRTVELTPPLITSELEIRRGVDLIGHVCLDWME